MHKPLPLIYCAGPISAAPMACTHDAVRHCMSVILDGGLGIPYIPHLTILTECIIGHRSHDYWLKYCEGIIRKSDAVYVFNPHGLPSTGTDHEIVYAREHDIPTFFSVHSLKVFAEKWQDA